jgi:hypothetical protein
MAYVEAMRIITCLHTTYNRICDIARSHGSLDLHAVELESGGTSRGRAANAAVIGISQGREKVFRGTVSLSV